MVRHVRSGLLVVTADTSHLGPSRMTGSYRVAVALRRLGLLPSTIVASHLFAVAVAGRFHNSDLGLCPSLAL